MNITKPLTAIAIATTLAGTHAAAFAQEGKSRAEVRAELADAIRTGDIVTGEFGFKRNQIWPALYPAQVESPGKTREQVRAERDEAVRTGDIITGDFGLKRNQIWPALYPAQVASPGKTREQVRAELDEAVRTGDIAAGDLGFKRNEIAPASYASGARSPSVKVAPANDEGASCKFDPRTIAWGYPQGAFGC